MNAVLISIRPQWCDLIKDGKKTVEVRRTRPMATIPFKCYIYQTKGGGVIGEFVCDRVTAAQRGEYCKIPLAETCLDVSDLLDYADDKTIYGWHISDLVIYDTPKDLGEFWNADKCPYASNDGCTYKYHCFRAGQMKRCGSTLQRPPQSWCYVEALV